MLRDDQILRAAWLSLRIAVMTATAAVVLGTLAGLVLARMGRFRGRLLFGGMTSAPLVMPEVITGLSLLLLFVALEDLIGWPRGRGAITITIAHVTFSMAYVAVVIQSQLANLDQRWKRRRWTWERGRPRCSASSRCRSSRRGWSPAGCSPSPCRWTI